MSTQEHKAIRAAVARSIIAIGKIKKGGRNPLFNSTYATLEQVLDVINPVVHSEGIAISQKPDYDAGGQCVSVTLGFVTVEGDELEWCKSALPLGKIYKKDGTTQEPNAQVACAAQTYCARTQLGHVFRLNLSDNDGNETVGEDADPPVARRPMEEAIAGAIAEAQKNDFTNPLKAPSFTFAGKKHVWKDKTNESLSAIIKGVGSAAGLPEAIKTRAQNELDSRNLTSGGMEKPY